MNWIYLDHPNLEQTIFEYNLFFTLQLVAYSDEFYIKSQNARLLNFYYIRFHTKYYNF